MPSTVEPDDEVNRFQSVFLGPEDHTWLFHARYIAYVWFGALFGLSLLIEFLTPLGFPMVWQIVACVLATYALMTAVDHDKPVAAVLANIWAVANAPSTPSRTTRTRPVARRIKITRSPL